MASLGDKLDPSFDRMFDLAENTRDDADVLAGLRKEDPDRIEQFIGWYGWRHSAHRRVLFLQELDKMRRREAEREAEQARRPTLRKFWYAFLEQLPAQFARGLYILIGAGLAFVFQWLTS